MAEFYEEGHELEDGRLVETMTETGYLLVGGGFLPFTVAHPRPAASALVALDGWLYSPEVGR